MPSIEAISFFNCASLLVADLAIAMFDMKSSRNTAAANDTNFVPISLVFLMRKSSSLCCFEVRITLKQNIAIRNYFVDRRGDINNKILNHPASIPMTLRFFDNDTC